MQRKEIKLEKKHTFYTEHIIEVGDYVTVSHADYPAKVLFIDYVEGLIYLHRSGSIPKEIEGKRPYRSTQWEDFNFAIMKPEQLLFVSKKNDNLFRFQTNDVNECTIFEEDLKPINDLLIKSREKYLNDNFKYCGYK